MKRKSIEAVHNHPVICVFSRASVRFPTVVRCRRSNPDGWSGSENRRECYGCSNLQERWHLRIFSESISQLGTANANQNLTCSYQISNAFRKGGNMNARWTIGVAGFTGLLLLGAILATAAAPSVGKDQLPPQGSNGTIQVSALVGMAVLDPQGQKLGRIKGILLDSRTGQATFIVVDAGAAPSHRMTYSAAHPIENPAMPAPSLPPSVTADQSPAQPVMPPPCMNATSANSDLPKDLEDFYNE